MLVKASTSDLLWKILFKFSTNLPGQKWLDDQCNVVVGDISFLEAVMLLSGERKVNETMKNENKKVSFRHDVVNRISESIGNISITIPVSTRYQYRK